MPIRRLRLVAFSETRIHSTARCLEYDIIASAHTVEGAVDALLKMIAAHIAFDYRHGRKPLSAFAPAPPLYRDAFRQSARHWVFDMQSIVERSPGPTQIDVALLPQHPAVRVECTARSA
jgi:hypothetical protein